MTDNQTITLRQDEFAGYQRAIESAKDRIALLVRERDEARQRERVVTETYMQQQDSYRELETLYQAAQERAIRAEAELDAAQAVVAAARPLADDPAYADVAVLCFALRAALTDYSAVVKGSSE